MASFSHTIGLAVFCVTSLCYAAAAVLVFLSRATEKQTLWLAVPLAVSAAWAAAEVYGIASALTSASWLRSIDAFHTAVWIVFLAMMLRRTAGETGVRLGRLLGVAALIMAVAGMLPATVATGGEDLSGQARGIALLALPLLGLLALEQVFRNATLDQRRVLRPLVLGLGLVFAVDIAAYSEMILFGGMDFGLWTLRGVGDVAAVPLILLAVKRQSSHERELFVSRHIVFYTTTLIAAGLYLLVMGIGGFVIGRDRSWGIALQLLFFVCTSLVFLYGLFSSAVRRHVKVFIAKHFYRNRYDYREEWLRLTRTLAGLTHEESLPDRSVRALADIVGSSRGQLWMRVGAGAPFVGYGGWGGEAPSASIALDESLVQFIARTHWVVDTVEYCEDPEKYSNAFTPDAPWVMAPSLYVPLIHEENVIGVVRLDRPEGLHSLDYEDHDLLKTAGRQVAVFLVQERSREALAETRQFEAYTKFTAYLMHDLKNTIAQQELVIGNARRFKHRPDFFDDAITTLESSVARMRSVLWRIQGGGGQERIARVDLDRILIEACNACEDRLPRPMLGEVASHIRINVDRDRLRMALTNAIRNAQDATESTGRIELRLLERNGTALIEVEDTGCGMEAEFVRNHLYKPFYSTKGAKGMGIGAYQIRETLRAIGGDVEVESELGRGTLIRMVVPLVRTEVSASEQCVA
jgi:putative PEP-CTERM system histidine kinase